MVETFLIEFLTFESADSLWTTITENVCLYNFVMESAS